ncbi:adenylate cyclase [Pseudomonas paraeruginosa]|uniref:poly(ethylene terephthalate) hydrolase family protein n=1 Tax=Pseudomonas paraeruginosa TaxID=2994495 RepID=UPI0039FDA053
MVSFAVWGDVVLDGEKVEASQLFPAVGLANDQYARVVDDQDVISTAVLSDCRGLVGVISKIVVLDKSIKCNEAFPYGFSSPISTSVYYPANISEVDGKLPVISFVGGILSNSGYYDEMVKLWVSYGFIVVNSSDFINSFPLMHTLGILEVDKMNKDPQSDIFEKADFSRTIVAGHSAGGQAALQFASLSEKSLQTIRPGLQLVGVLPIEPGPLAVGFTVKVPSLMLTGFADVVVPFFTWPNLWQLPLMKDVPAWGATATTATHFSPVRPVPQNEFAGISVAWMLYRAQQNSDAKDYFVGRYYKLGSDIQFNSPLHFLKASRNKLASSL